MATSNTKPRTWSVCGTNGLALIRLIDCRTSVSRSVNDSAAHGGLSPVSSWMRLLELVVGEGQHPAVGVVDQDDLLGAEQALGDGQRADLVVGDDAARVADDVRVAFVQAEDAVDVEPGVHAGDDGDVLGRGQRERAGEGLRVAGVVGEQIVGDGHGFLLVGGWNRRRARRPGWRGRAGADRTDRSRYAAGRQSSSNWTVRRLGQKASSSIRSTLESARRSGQGKRQARRAGRPPNTRLLVINLYSK